MILTACSGVVELLKGTEWLVVICCVNVLPVNESLIRLDLKSITLLILSATLSITDTAKGWKGPLRDLTLDSANMPVYVWSGWRGGGNILPWRYKYVLAKCKFERCLLLFELFSFLLETHVHLNSHQELQMYITSVQNSPVQLTCTCLWLLKAQFRCDKFTQGPSGSAAGRGNTAHTIKMTTGIPAIPHVVFVRESFLCCWSYELARVC